MASDLPADKLSYTITEAVKVTGISRTRIFNLMRDGLLPRVKLGSATLIRRSDLERLLDDHLIAV